MFHFSADWALLPGGFAADVCVGIEDGWIVSVAEGGALGERVAGAVLPGMADLHSHAFQRVFAGCTEFDGGGGDFWSWRDTMYGAVRRMTPELLAPVAAWLGKELLLGGYTSVAEFHYLQHDPNGRPYGVRTAMADALVAGAAASSIGLSVLVGVYEHGGFGGASLGPGQRRFAQSAEDALSMIAALRTQYGDRVGVGLALHSLRAVPPASLAIAVHGLAAVAPGAPIHIHVAEQPVEVAACVAEFGTTPIAWLLDHAPVDERWCLVHATHATLAELREAAACGAVMGLCPSTEANLGDGTCDFSSWRAAEGAFGIGSDSNVMLDAFGELALLEYGQRLRLQRRNVGADGQAHTGRALWQAAASGGGQACGRSAGRIAVGQRADLIIIEPTPESEKLDPDFWLDAAIFAAGRRPVRHAMADGAWVVRDGIHRSATAIDAAYRDALRRMRA